MPEQQNIVKHKFEQLFHRDKRHCSCEMPRTATTWNDALGTLSTVRLCCMAKAVEEIAEFLNLNVGTLYEVFHFDPRWEWDCKQMVDRTMPDGTVERVEQGPPPRWIRERMEQKGIKVLNDK